MEGAGRFKSVVGSGVTKAIPLRDVNGPKAIRRARGPADWRGMETRSAGADYCGGTGVGKGAVPGGTGKGVVSGSGVVASVVEITPV